MELRGSISPRNKVLNMAELLFGAGIAMLIAILAWSDQISSLHKDTLEAENLLSAKRNVDWKIVRSILKNISDPNESLKKLKEVFDKSSSKNIENIDIIYQLRYLGRQSRRLKVYYQIKYYLTILLTLSFFVGGTLAFLIRDSEYLCLFKIKISRNFLPGIFCILLSVAVLVYIVFLNLKEFRYRTNFVNLIDQI